MSLLKLEFDPVHSTIGFSIRHLVVSKVHGRFARWGGTLEVDEANPEASRIQVQIDADSIDTHDAGRDAHLRSADFFDVERYPQITFESTSIEDRGEGRFLTTGDLTIHGVTRQVVLDVEYAGRVQHPQMGDRAGFNARTWISRKDFGMTFNQVLEAGGLAVGDRVDIAIDIEAVVPVPAAV